MIYYDICCRDELRPRARYIFRCFAADSGLPLRELKEGETPGSGSIVIVYGGVFNKDLYRDLAWKEGALIHIHSAGMVTKIVDSFSHRGREIPVYGEIGEVDEENFPGVLKSKEGYCLVGQAQPVRIPAVIITMDIIMASFRILTRMEERENPNRDAYGRFPIEESEAAIYQFLDLPVVNIYFEILLRAVREVSEALKRPIPRLMKWPGGEPFAAFMSHDVDLLKKWTPKRIVWEAVVSLRQLITGNMDTLRKNLNSYLQWRRTGWEPYWNFENLIKLEKSAGISSTYFFCAYGNTGKFRKRREEPVYRESVKTLDHLLNRLSSEGFEISLHGTGNAFVNQKELSTKKKNLEHHLDGIVRGLRHHYLRFEVDKTLTVAWKAGILYDSTLGYAASAGFRSGYAGPYFPYDWSRGEALPLVELPLNAMDTIFEHAQDSPHGEVEESILQVIECSARWGGLFSFLLHNSSLDESDFPGRKDSYLKLINRICELGGCFFTGAEAANWHLRRAAFECLHHSHDFGTEHIVYRSPNEIDEITVLIEKPPDWTVGGFTCSAATHRLVEKSRSIFIYLTSIKKDQKVAIDIRWDIRN